MKLLIMLLIFFLNPALNAHRQAVVNNAAGNNKVIIAGKIHNATMKTIGITSLEPVKGRQQYTARLNDSGEFNITLNASGPHDYFINYEGLHTLFLKAGR